MIVFVWHQSEWHEHLESKSAYYEGYKADVFPSDTKAEKWTWLVCVTAAISETPEVIDIGSTDSIHTAMTAAERCLMRETT